MNQFEKFQKNSGLYGGNAPYIEDLYERYLQDRNSVSSEWQSYFQEYEAFLETEVPHGPIKQSFAELKRTPINLGGASESSDKQTAVLKLIAAYRRRGHQAADLCPLNLRERGTVSSLTLAHHGLSSADLDTEFNIGMRNHQRMTLREILEILQNAYTRHIGVEYMHITNPNERHWLQTRLETPGEAIQFSPEEKRETLKQLVTAEGLERYLHVRYVGQKRFSLEGGDALIPMMHELIRCAVERDAQEIVIGMAHRGRLNMLVNILGKSPQDLFAEFEGRPTFDKGSGDVKYHMGFSSTVDINGKTLHLALSFNPSHLEVVNPVIVGSARARLERRIGERQKSKNLPFNQVLPVQIHGDAAFAGQGVVMETMQLSEVRGYSCGGSVHIVINNQIGFTTSNPLDVRSATYCTDVAKMIQAPIFHVNGDDPEAVKFVIQQALAYRQTFNKDVVIDLVCYRRLGHNEADEPSATQPMMYEKINNHPVPSRIYADRLISENVITEEDYQSYIKDYRTRIETEKSVGFPLAKNPDLSYVEEWRSYVRNKHTFGTDEQTYPDTAVSEERILNLSRIMNELPEGLVLHPRVQRIHENRYKMGIGATPIDWGFAEIMAYATLLEDGYPVRLSGQDSRRGTFFHRHAVYYNQTDGQCYIPLEHLKEDQPKFTVIDSILSEFAVLGFEYGYATAEPGSLVIWEAQFGDFVNGAQVVIDQFIASGETKWRRLNGLVLLLPHGYEGQGPEHSSARPERFLGLCAENNMSVVVPTTPAQAFHMFRRQMLQDYRKPLICMSPKSLLRHRQAVSEMKDLTEGAFQPVIGEVNEHDKESVKRIIISVGKIYYDLYNERAAREADDVALLRLEEIYPFPSKLLKSLVDQYPNATEILFCQDEPRNQGYATFVRNYLEELFLESHRIEYATRPAAAAPAVGYNSQHIEQQRELLELAFAPLASISTK